MLSRWWQLPGPAGFVERVIDAWAHGRHSVLWLPEGMYPGLRSACRSELEHHGSAHWAVSLAVEGGHERPLEILCREFGASDPAEVATLSKCLANSTAAGGVVWIDGVCAGSWPSWQRILGEIEVVTRGLEPAQRTVLCLPVEGLPENSSPPTDVCLEVFTWTDVVDSIDALIFAASLCQGRNGSDDDRMLRALTIAHLALWDGENAEMLAGLTNEELYQPAEILREFAATRRWGPDDGEPCWRNGSAETWQSRRALHSAWLAARGEDHELRRRHWKAHIQVILPYVEEQRADLLGLVRSRLRVPYQTSTGDVVKRVEELEIGHIHWQLASDSYVDYRIRQKIRVLRDIRNALSHLEPVPPDLLFHRALERDFRRG